MIVDVATDARDELEPDKTSLTFSINSGMNGE